MIVVRNLIDVPSDLRGCVATIGNFDGVHLGHQQILDQLRVASGHHNLPAVMITFEPYPQEFFTPSTAPARLMRLREKIICLQQYAIDMILCLRFDQSLASVSAEAFIQQVLIDKLSVRHLIVGQDFRFGHNRSGNIDLLQERSTAAGFSIESAETRELDGRRISSSWVRECLATGDMQQAMKLTGRPYTISGRIVHGDKRGRSLGYPTININMHRLQSPVSGIYACRVHGLDTGNLIAVTSIGTRPVFNGAGINLEAYILDFDSDVYGRHVQVELCKRIREERNFETVDALKSQIESDITETREYFSA